MGATIVPLLATVHACDAVDDWTGTPTLDTEVFIQGTGSLSKKVSKAVSIHMKPIVAEDLSDTIIYVWVLGGSISQFDTKTGGGIRIRVEEGATPNWGEWYVAGSDEGYEGGWQCLAIRTTLSFSDVSVPAPDMTIIDKVGVVFDVTASAAKINCWWDAVRYGTGLRIKAGTEAEAGTFDDVVTAEETVDNRWGVVVRSEGVLMVQGQLVFGSTTAGEATYFKDTSKILVFRDRPFGVFYEIKIEGNATATTKVFFGTRVGETEEEYRGISGCIFSCAGASKYKITATNINITELGFYGCTFLDADTISLPSYSTVKMVLNCNFELCAEVLPDTCTVKYCKFISADDRALRFANTACGDYIKTNDFINCPKAVHISIAGTFLFDALMFSGNTCDIENSTAGGDVYIDRTNDSNPDPAKLLNSGTPQGTITINPLSVYLTITVVDEAGNAIQNAQVYIQKTSPTAFTSDAGNDAGDPDLIVNEVVDTDIPQTGWLIVWDKSADETMPYRYASWAIKTFTLRTEVTGSATSTGSGTSLISTTTNFLTEDFEEGDTIRNTMDGSWAVIDEIVDADNVTTSQLQGGTDNIWESGDGFSVHRLAVSLVDNDDRIDIPLMNMQTDSSGEATKTYSYSTDLAITVRIRSQQGATKYIPYDTSGTIKSTGYTLTAVLYKDEVSA